MVDITTYFELETNIETAWFNTKWWKTVEVEKAQKIKGAKPDEKDEEIQRAHGQPRIQKFNNYDDIRPELGDLDDHQYSICPQWVPVYMFKSRDWRGSTLFPVHGFVANRAMPSYNRRQELERGGVQSPYDRQSCAA